MKSVTNFGVTKFSDGIRDRFRIFPLLISVTMLTFFISVHVAFCLVFCSISFHSCQLLKKEVSSERDDFAIGLN